MSAGAASRGYLAGKADEVLYPLAGDPKPPGGAKVNLLTIGNVMVQGTWDDSGRYLGWAPLHKRNRQKEEKVKQALAVK